MRARPRSALHSRLASRGVAARPRVGGLGQMALGLGLLLAGSSPAGAALPEGYAQVLGPARVRAESILRFAKRWLGTPYQWGGSSRAGIDCSAFSRTLYRDVFGLRLLRTTRQQIHLGRRLPLSPSAPSRGLEPGDLVFFVDGAGTPNHVLTYVGDGLFAHSVGGRGVVVEGPEALEGRRLVGRRLIQPAGGSTPAIAEAAPEAPRAAPHPPPAPEAPAAARPPSWLTRADRVASAALAAARRQESAHPLRGPAPAARPMSPVGR